jgi:hypothetical protein
MKIKDNMFFLWSLKASQVMGTNPLFISDSWNGFCFPFPGIKKTPKKEDGCEGNVVIPPMDCGFIKTKYSFEIRCKHPR